MSKTQKLRPCKIPDLIRHLFLAWLCSTLLEYLYLPQSLQNISGTAGIAQMSLLRLLITTGVLTAGLLGLSLRYNLDLAERWSIAGVFMLLSVATLVNTFTWGLFGFCILIFAVLVVYAIWGRQQEQPANGTPQKAHWAFLIVIAVLAAFVFADLCVWGIHRILTLSSPCFDLGIFSQMFHYMKETGLPLTTVERSEGLMSHFKVHVSPVYYLMLPFYWLFPTPATLQVLQAAIVVSGVIPLWLIGKQRGLPGLPRTFLCALLLFSSAVMGGVSYDMHENCFLLPFILWLFYGIEKRNFSLSILFSLLTMTVKEDAPVYVAIAALYLIIRTAMDYDKSKRKELLIGTVMFALSLIWFFLATNYLATQGDGVMTYRYNTFIYDNSGSLFTVIKAIVLCPAKLLYECTKEENRLLYIMRVLVPLLCLPLLTRKYARYILLVPFLLINLMPTWKYQYDIYFQYNFGSSAFLLYAAAMNLADIRWEKPRLITAITAAAVSLGFFCGLIIPRVSYYTALYSDNQAYYQSIHQVLDTVPEDASVTAHSFYIVPFSQRDILYDVRYCTKEQMLSTEYIVLKRNSTADYQNTLLGVTGFENVDAMLIEKGYIQQQNYGNLIIYHKN